MGRGFRRRRDSTLVFAAASSLLCWCSSPVVSQQVSRTFVISRWSIRLAPCDVPFLSYTKPHWRRRRLRSYASYKAEIEFDALLSGDDLAQPGTAGTRPLLAKPQS